MAENDAKHILIVIAHNNFRDEEYSSVRNSLETAGAKVTVASTVMENAAGSQGLKVKPDKLIDDVDPADFDGVIFVGGTGSSQYWHDVNAHGIVTHLNAGGKLVAASSHAPVTLAVAGILSGKKATGHITIYEKLQVAGAHYTGKKLEVDGNVITSAGANAAKEFSQALTKALK